MNNNNDYRVHKVSENSATVFIKGNGIYGHYLVSGDKVVKFTEDVEGDEVVSDFHVIGDLPLNSEALLLNRLRERGEV